ncbi:MAG: excinuclease ABC subunit UvrC, partial [Flavobacteriales bacterium]
YVGKAKSLRNRVGSYFNTKRHESGKTQMLVRKIADLRYVVVETEMDALLLENSLIKQYKPKYNINLKDDKTYPWIVIKKEPFPRVFATRQMLKDGSEYFGPFASVKAMYAVLDMVKKIHPIRTCSLPLAEAKIQSGKFKICLEYHLGNCLGPCEGKQSLADYDSGINHIREVLKGRFGDVVKSLKSEMNDRAQELAFEAAQTIKDKLEAIERFQAKSTIVHPSIDDVDVFSIVCDDSSGFVNYMKVQHGIIVLSFNVTVRKKMEESAEDLLAFALLDLRERFQSSSREIFLPFEMELPLEGVSIHVPLRGDKKKLIELSQSNATRSMLDAHRQMEATDPERHTQRVLTTIQSDLHLKELPVHMECFDNSNIQGTHPVSACVVFKNAKPSKSDYRIFHPKTVEGPDDFATMREVIYRRYKRMLEEGETLPQLIIIDGGKGQLSAALESIDALQLRGRIAIIGIAKRLEEIYFPGDTLPIYLDKRSETLKVIQHLRDEAHRFGITKHRNRRSHDALRSELMDIPGVGEKTMQQLIAHFKSVTNIRKASVEALQEIVNAKLAALIHVYFHNKPDDTVAP